MIETVKSHDEGIDVEPLGEFFHDRLHLTPNRLSTLVKDYSGRTVADWVNIAIIHEAKVLLRYSDLSSYEIADRLNFSAASAFSAFFKRQTSLTPGQYCIRMPMAS